MCSNGETEYGLRELLTNRTRSFSSKAEALKVQENHNCTSELTAHQLDCGECNECSTFCDVCGSWYSDEEPCEFH